MNPTLQKILEEFDEKLEYDTLPGAHVEDSLNATYNREAVKDFIISALTSYRKELIKKTIYLVSTHTEHDGDYCDTGEDMEWICRSKCVEMAINRLSKLEET